MKHNLDDAVLLKTRHQSVYKLRQEGLENEYLIVSGDGTRRLMASPEVVGFGSYQSMVPATMKGMQYLVDNGLADDVNILTILRGGLNYPIEECAFRAGLRVTNMDFLSCERIIEDDVIKGLDVRYQKVRTCRDCVMIVGDIIASGATLRMCMEHVIDWFRDHGGSFKRIVFFTIGGSNAIDFMEDLAAEVRTFSPAFEGFTCFFYEGIFNVYQDKGLLGFQIPDIDFYWGGGIISPEFREYVVAHGYSLYEKCIIYDGGARRYEIPDHYKEVISYWTEVLEASGRVDIMDLTQERLGYKAPISYEDWLKVTRFTELGDQSVLYSDERVFLAKAKALTLKEVATKRIEQIKQTLKGYE
ncbi:MAG: phosphoribosyltransferase [Bacteroidales bacterium]|nr:phosphoribosyltransferase [Bacteroidales bacterium]